MILPGGTIGLLGGGQLGRMLTLRAREMGYRIVVLEPDPLSPAAAVAQRHLCAPYDDPIALDKLAALADAVTLEFENVPADALRILAERVPVRPDATAVAVAQDRIAEKTFFRDHGFATAPFREVASEAALPDALRAVGAPALLKTSRLGYDGKGQAPVASAAEARQAFRALGGVPCVLERRLTLERELSVTLARGADGLTACFPVAENVHRAGILDSTTVPAGVPEPLRLVALARATRLADALAYVGVLAVEMFVAEGGDLYLNEIAPRPHNSGHYTLDACVTDQFEQQLRALCGLALGEPTLLQPVVMLNLLGDLWGQGPIRWDEALAVPGVKLHLYGKKEPRPGRKMGHVNVLGPTVEEALERARRVRRILGLPERGD